MAADRKSLVFLGVRRTCRWSLFHSGRWFCKLPAIRNPGQEPPTALDDGCPEECANVDIVPWKVDLYGDDYDNALPSPKVLEWSEET